MTSAALQKPKSLTGVFIAVLLLLPSAVFAAASPDITTPPQSQVVRAGSNVVFTVVATGAGTLSYQWSLNGTNLANGGRVSGATNATLTISNVVFSDAGTYQVVVSNSHGTATTNATLTVLSPPVITTLPANRVATVLPDDHPTSQFSIVAAGTDPLSYQWRFNGAILPAQTNSALTISNIQLTDDGNYTVIITNNYGSVTSSVATLTVFAVLQTPQSLYANWGGNASFSITVTNLHSLPMTYQWYFEQTNLLSGQTNATLLLTNVQSSQAGWYNVQWTSIPLDNGSSGASLWVVMPPPGTPVILSTDPDSGIPGTTVTITGTNFSSAAESNIVYFGATRANVLSAGATNLAVAVPFGATFGPITETVGGLTAYSTHLFEPTFTGNGSNIDSSTFPASFTLGAGGRPYSAVIVDLDGDGRPDVILCGGNHTVSIFQNIGAAGAPLTASSFAPRVDLPFPSNGGTDSPYNVRAVDLDGDGKPDLMAMEVGGNQIAVFHNLSTPGSLTTNSFAPAFSLTTGSDCRFAAAADLNDDGRVDIVALNYGDKTISIFQNIGSAGVLTNSSFASPVVLASPGGPYQATIADLDGDGRPDLAVVEQDNSTISIYQNESVGGVIAFNSFGPEVDLPATDNPDSIVAADMDGDGKIDLAAATVHGETVSVYRNISSPGLLTSNSFATHVDFGTANWTFTLAAADFNGDGRPDITSVGQIPSHMSVFQNVSTPGSFTGSSFAPRVDFASGYNSAGVAAGDLNGDGRPDIVLCNVYDYTLQIYQNQMPFGGPPVIIAQPTNATVAVSFATNLAVSVTGQLPLSYQWYFGGTNLADDGRITGVTTGTLSISNAQSSDAGNYYLVVTNSFGSTTSAVVTLTTIVLPPVFDMQPPSQTNIVGSNATITASVSGSQPLTYQWFMDGAPLSDAGRISGATGNSLTISDLQTNDAADYWVVVSNAADTVTSAVASLTVLVPPSFILQPASQTVVAGSNAVFTALGDGTPPLNYLWYFNNAPLSDGVHIAGSSTPMLIISNVENADIGDYSVRISNVANSLFSTNAALTVLVPPVITLQPIGRSLPLGLTNIFAANASGSGPISYQWQLNGTNIPGATNGIYFIPAVGTNDFGVYQFIATSAAGTAVSSNALLTHGPVVAWGYDYYHQCDVPPGLSNVTTVAGSYNYSLASLLDGSIAAWGAVNPAGGTIVLILNPSMTNVIAVSASPLSSGTGILALRSDGSVVGTGAIDPAKIYLSNAVAIAAGGNAGFGLALRAEGTVVGWGSFSQAGFIPATSPPGLAHITAISAGYEHALALRDDGTVAAWGMGTATNVPIGLSNVVAIAAGGTYSLALKSDGTVVAWGSGAGTNVPAGLSNVVGIAAGNYFDQRTSVGYAVKSDGTVVGWGLGPYNNSLTNIPPGLSNVVSVAAGAYHALALVNDGSPQILQQPAGATAWSGRDWKLQVVAAGAAPLNYQWLFNGTNIDGATNATLLLPAIHSTVAGNYQVIVSNSLGVATSLAAPITVMDSTPFLLTLSPTNPSAYLGNKLVLSAAVAGSGPLHYQWQLNSNNIASGTNDTLTFARLHLSDTGSYRLIVTNSFGAITGAVIRLTVQQVLVWGDNSYGQTNVPSGFTNVTAISAGLYGNIVLKADGKVTVWGGYGVSTNTGAISNVVEVSAGQNSYLVLKSGGRPYVWGAVPLALSNYLAAQSNIVSALYWDSRSELLRSDGTVVLVYSDGTAVTNTVVTNGIALENFDNNYLVLKADGTIYPTIFYSYTNIYSIAGSPSYNQTIALKRDGKISEYPMTLLSTNLSNVIGVASIGYGPLDFAVLSDGSVVWGAPNGYYNPATNVPYGLISVQTLDTGYLHGLALLSDRDFPPVFLPTALDTTNFIVSSRGSPQWFGQTNVSHDGISAAQSATVGNNLSSSMRMWMAGPRLVKFWWKVSSATNHGILSFSAGGTVLTNVSGEVDWRQCTAIVPPGNHILQWTYARDGAPAAGQDAAWVDQLIITNLPPTILVQPQPAEQVVIGGTNVIYSVTAVGTPPMVYSWRKDGTTIQFGSNSNLVLANVTSAASATYQVVINSPYGMAISSNAVLIVHERQLLSPPAFQLDGSLLLSAANADGSPLTTSDLARLEAQASTNLVDWTTLSNALTLTNGMIQLQDPDATNSTQRFYRILETW